MLPSLKTVFTHSQMLLHTVRDSLTSITMKIALFRVAVCWRNGLPSHRIPGSIPGQTAVADHFARTN
jgi:hypothetical protein